MFQHSNVCPDHFPCGIIIVTLLYDLHSVFLSCLFTHAFSHDAEGAPAEIEFISKCIVPPCIYSANVVGRLVQYAKDGGSVVKPADTLSFYLYVSLSEKLLSRPRAHRDNTCTLLLEIYTPTTNNLANTTSKFLTLPALAMFCTQRRILLAGTPHYLHPRPWSSELGAYAKLGIYL